MHLTSLYWVLERRLESGKWCAIHSRDLTHELSQRGTIPGAPGPEHGIFHLAENLALPADPEQDFHTLLSTWQAEDTKTGGADRAAHLARIRLPEDAADFTHNALDPAESDMCDAGYLSLAQFRRAAAASAVMAEKLAQIEEILALPPIPHGPVFYDPETETHFPGMLPMTPHGYMEALRNAGPFAPADDTNIRLVFAYLS